MVIINEHEGFALFDVNIYGLASHGSRPDLGIDAICKAGYFLVELDQLASKMQKPVPPVIDLILNYRASISDSSKAEKRSLPIRRNAPSSLTVASLPAVVLAHLNLN